MDDSSKLQGLREYRKFLLGNKAALETLRDGYGEIETPSPEALAAGRSDRLWLTITGMAKTAQFHAENDIEVVDAMIGALDKCIELVEAGEEERAKGVFFAIPDLAKQFAAWSSTPGRGRG